MTKIPDYPVFKFPTRSGSSETCGKCKSVARCSALSLSSRTASTVAFLCESCLAQARTLWKEFMNADV